MEIESQCKNSKIQNVCKADIVLDIVWRISKLCVLFDKNRKFHKSGKGPIRESNKGYVRYFIKGQIAYFEL